MIMSANDQLAADASNAAPTQVVFLAESSLPLVPFDAAELDPEFAKQTASRYLLVLSNPRLNI